MKAFAYVYSRTKKHEYGKLSDLSDTNHPQALDRVRGFVQSSDGLEQPQWLMIKEGNSVLWGLGCMNDYLDEMYSYDEGFRPIRCFTGIVMTDYSGEALPYDIEFFRTVFRTVMGRVFDSSSQKQLVDTVVDIGTASSFIYPQPFDSKLNKDYHQCRVFSSTVNAESLVASCLSCPEDISIAINVARIESVTTPRFNPLMNAVMRDAMPEEMTDIPVKHLCNSCGKAVDELYGGLCQECWDAQHPRCVHCGKETSLLHEGLCQDCWNKLHPRCINCGKETSDLRDGLCRDCYEQQHPRCNKCKMEFDDLSALSPRGLCKKCEKKRRLKLWIGIVIVLLSLLFAFVRYDKATGSIYFHWPVIERNGFFKPSNKTVFFSCIVRDIGGL